MEKKLARVALFLGGLKRAGLERVVCDLAIGMKEKDMDVTVVAFTGGDLLGELKEAHVDVAILGNRNPDEYQPTLLKSLQMILKAVRILKRKRIQVLNVHGLGADRIALFAARIAATPIKTFVFHSNYPALHPKTGDRALRHRLARNLRSVQHCIAVSDQVKEYIVGCDIVDQDKLSTINNGIDLRKCRRSHSRASTRANLGFTEDDVVLIQVGRFQAPKNQRISVNAMKRVTSLCPNAHLLLVGDGPDFDVTRKSAEESGLLSHVHFLGLRRDVPDLLGASDLFLLPSSWEGLPISLLEAFANSLPLIGADVPGIRNVVSIDPSCAKLVKGCDADALANAIIEAIQDKPWRIKSMGSASGIVERHFDFNKSLETYVDLHGALLQRKDT